MKRKSTKTTSLWGTKDGFWRIQTDDSKVANKLNRRKSFKACIFGVNCYLRGFSFGPCATAEALKKTRNATGLKLKKNSTAGTWDAIPAQK